MRVPKKSLSPSSKTQTFVNLSALHFLDAPKFVRFLLVCASFSLSSVSLFLGLFALFPVAEVGVGLPDALSRYVVDKGVGAGVEPTDPGAEESWTKSIQLVTWTRKMISRVYLQTGSTYPISWSIWNWWARKDAILFRRTRLASLSSCATCALHVVVKASNDVAARGAV